MRTVGSSSAPWSAVTGCGVPDSAWEASRVARSGLGVASARRRSVLSGTSSPARASPSAHESSRGIFQDRGPALHALAPRAHRRRDLARCDAAPRLERVHRREPLAEVDAPVGARTPPPAATRWAPRRRTPRACRRERARRACLRARASAPPSGPNAAPHRSCCSWPGCPLGSSRPRVPSCSTTFRFRALRPSANHPLSNAAWPGQEVGCGRLAFRPWPFGLRWALHHLSPGRRHETTEGFLLNRALLARRRLAARRRLQPRAARSVPPVGAGGATHGVGGHGGQGGGGGPPGPSQVRRRRVQQGLRREPEQLPEGLQLELHLRRRRVRPQLRRERRQLPDGLRQVRNGLLRRRHV